MPAGLKAWLLSSPCWVWPRRPSLCCLQFGVAGAYTLEMWLGRVVPTETTSRYAHLEVKMLQSDSWERDRSKLVLFPNAQKQCFNAGA